MPHHTQLHQLRASTQHRHRRQRRGSSRRRHWRRHRRRLAAVAEARIRPTCHSLVAILGHLPRCLGWAPGAVEVRRDELDDSGYHQLAALAVLQRVNRINRGSDVEVM